MSAHLSLADAATAADLRTYAGRAAALDRDGAIRLQAQGTVLAAYVDVLPGAGLSGDGLVLGLRTMRLAEDADLDTTVPLAGLLDRFAHHGGTDLAIPPTEVSAPWAGQSPPRAGWVPVGRLTTDEIRAAADQGIATVAEAAPEGARALAVAELRARVWAAPIVSAGAPGVPSGAAFGATALGFLVDAPATVHRCGRWLRLSTPVGHVLTR